VPLGQRIPDVTAVTTGSNAFALGTSNEINFSLTAGYVWGVRVITDGTCQGFTGGNSSTLMPDSDVLHGTNLSITFAQTV
jgi:hypothetical protein